MFYCFSLHVTATSEYNVHVCIYTVMYFTYGYNNDVNNYFFLLGLLYCEASAKTWVLSKHKCAVTMEIIVLNQSLEFLMACGYLTIITWVGVGYEMVDRQQGA